MRRFCPVCLAVCETAVCPRCGTDHTLQYELFDTLSRPDSFSPLPVTAQRRLYDEKTRGQSPAQAREPAQKSAPSPRPDHKPAQALPVLQSDNCWSDSGARVFGSALTRAYVDRIQVLDHLPTPVPQDAWDVSAARDRSVLAWTRKSGAFYYALYIAGEGGVQAPEDCSRLFNGYRNVQMIDFGLAFHTSQTRSMHSMFRWCCHLKHLDLSGWDTALVTDMESMFYQCSDLTELDLRGFAFERVRNVSFMFAQCTGLTQLRTNYDLLQIEKHRGLFDGCTQLDVHAPLS